MNDSDAPSIDKKISSEPLSTKPVENSTGMVKKSSVLKIVIIVSGILILLGLICAVVIFVLLKNYFVPIGQNISPTPTINPTISVGATIEPTLTVTPVGATSDIMNEVFYEYGNTVTRYNISTKVSDIWRLNNIYVNGGGIEYGNTEPILSPNHKEFAVLVAQDSLEVHYINDVVDTVSVVKPTKGAIEIHTVNFSKNSTKLLFNIKCVVPIDDVPAGFQYCPDDYSKNNTGFYYYDLSTKTVNKVVVQDSSLLDFSTIKGWSSYDDNIFIGTIDTRKSDGYLNQTKIVEINTKTGQASVLKTITLGDYIWVELAGIDKNKNILIAKSIDTKSWELYLNDKLIKTESSFTYMQFVGFDHEDDTKITYYSNTSSSAEFKVIDRNGNLITSKMFVSPETDPIKLSWSNGKYLFVKDANGLEGYSYPGWAVVLSIPEVNLKGETPVIMK